MNKLSWEIIKFIFWVGLIGTGFVLSAIWLFNLTIEAFVFAGFLAAILAFSNMALFWPAVFVFFVVVSIFYDDDWLWAGIFFFVLPVVLLFVLFNGVVIPPLSTLLLFSGGYLVVGFGWSFVKWLLTISKLRNQLEQTISTYKPEYLKPTNWSEVTSHDKGKYLYDRLNSKEKDLVKSADFWNFDFVPKLSNNKARVTRWIMYWPLSFLNYLFGRLLKDLIEAILNKLRGLYDAAARWMMGNLKV